MKNKTIPYWHGFCQSPKCLTPNTYSQLYLHSSKLYCPEKKEDYYKACSPCVLRDYKDFDIKRLKNYEKKYKDC